MANKAAEFYQGLNETLKNKVDSIMPFRANAHAVVDGKVQIKELGSDSPLDESYARLAGAPISPNDEVAVMHLSGQPFVLGRIIRSAADDHYSGVSGGMVANVKGYGAKGDGVNDDTTAILSAFTAIQNNGGGTVYFPMGMYRISQALPIFNHLHIEGDGEYLSEIKQTNTSAHGLSGVDVQWFSIDKITIDGPASGSGDGIRMTRSSNDATNYIFMDRVTVQEFGNDGISISNCIVSRFNMVHSRLNGRHGWNIYGVSGGSAGTSCQFNVCYANENDKSGFLIDTMTYMHFSSCVAERNGIEWNLRHCYSMDFSSCGTENTRYEDASYGGVSFMIYQCLGLTFHNPYVLQGRNYGYWITNGSENITLIAPQEIDPQGTMVNSIRVDAGTTCTILDYNVVRPMSIATYTTTILHDDGQLTLRNTLNFGSNNNFYSMGNLSLGTDSKITSWSGFETTGNIVGASFNSPYIYTHDQEGANVGSTTSTSQFYEALTATINLPSGTWDVTVDCAADFRHSANGNVRFLTNFDGNESLSFAPQFYSGSWSTGRMSLTFTGISNGQKLIKFMYRSSTAGTSYAKNPRILVIARRTS